MGPQVRRCEQPSGVLRGSRATGKLPSGRARDVGLPDLLHRELPPTRTPGSVNSSRGRTRAASARRLRREGLARRRRRTWQLRGARARARPAGRLQRARAVPRRELDRGVGDGAERADEDDRVEAPLREGELLGRGVDDLDRHAGGRELPGHAAPHRRIGLGRDEAPRRLEVGEAPDTPRPRRPRVPEDRPDRALHGCGAGAARRPGAGAPRLPHDGGREARDGGEGGADSPGPATRGAGSRVG